MSTLSTFPFTDANGRPWAATIVRNGDRYGLNDCLTNEGGTLIEFYDRKYAGRKSEWGHEFPAEGQFVSRYYATTLLLGNPRSALCLYGGCADAWTIDGDSMFRVLSWVAEQLGGAA